jgi:hypothetical protein
MGADPPEPSTEVVEYPLRAQVRAAAAPKRDLIGRGLGRFTIVELIGKGGGGEVYRAEQAPLGRSAVIKVLRPDLTPGPPRVERFLREAKLASQLDHPYAAHVYAFGAEPDGLLWIAMEHVRGTTLEQLVAGRGPIPPAVFAPLFERLCEVVQSAHDLGIVHRDIKLPNVMVIERAGQLLPKLLDFGIAKGEVPEPAIEGGAAPAFATELTGHGATIGSPPYMAPEQWQRPHDVDGRADIYALGVLAYRCLAGRAPIHGSTRAELAHAHVHQRPPPLGVGAPALDEAIRRALAKSPDDRWPRALDLAAALRKAVGGGEAEPVPILDAAVRDVWEKLAPQPIAEVVALLAGAATTIEADQAVRDLVDVTCRWLAAIALAGARGAETKSGTPGDAVAALRARARAVTEAPDAPAWLALARAACEVSPALPELPAVLADTSALAAMAERQARGRRGRTAADLAADVRAVTDALAPLEALLEYRLVVGGDDGADVWTGVRAPRRPRALVWGDAVAVGEVVLLDRGGRIALRLTPLVRARRPLPHGDIELFLIAAAGKGNARLAAVPWGYEGDDEEAGRFLEQLRSHDSTTAEERDAEGSPFPGLAPFGVDDAERFFGREAEIDGLANRLVKAAMVAVVGPSGVGKSSFVHAGLTARLREHHRVIALRPGRFPSAALAAAIDRAEREREGGDPAGFAGGAGVLPRGIDREDGRGIAPDAAPEVIAARLREVAGDAHRRGTVLIVDQFEEVATLCDDAADRERFAAALAAAASAGTGTVRVVVTLRDDFASLLESIDALRGRFEVFVLGAPSAQALRRILIEPARRSGVTIEGAVVDDIVTEVAGRPAALPLLGFTAARLWALRDREKRVMTRSAYATLGGVGGALALYADEVYGGLGRREQAIARDLFGRLVAEDGTRVPMPRRELASLDAGTGVIDRLVDARLFTARDADGGDASETDDVIELVHECLALRWPRLVRWRSEDAADRAVLSDLRAAARRWREHAGRRDLLWRGAAVADLERLAPLLTDREREFAAASIAASRRAVRVRRAIVAGGVAALVAVAGVMTYLSRQADASRRDAQVNARSARAAAGLAEDRLTRSLIVQGRRELDDGRTPAALAYFAEALRRGGDSEALRLMIGLAAWPWRHQRLAWQTSWITIVAHRNDVPWFVASDVEGHVRWWGLDGATRGSRDLGSGVQRVAIDHRGKTITATLAGRAVVMDAAGNAPDREVALPDQTFYAVVGPGADELTAIGATGPVVLGLDGARRRAVVVPGDGAWRQYPAADGVHWLLINDTGAVIADTTAGTSAVVVPGAVRLATASTDGNAFAVLDVDGAIHVLAGDGKRRATYRPPRPADTLALSADGSIVAIQADRTVHVHAVGTARRTDLAVEPHQVSVMTVDGDDVWAGGEDGTVRHWRGDRLIAAMPVHVSAIDAIFIAGDALITTAGDGTLAVSDRDASAIDPNVADPCQGGIRPTTSITLYPVVILPCGGRRGAIVRPGRPALAIEDPYAIDAAAVAPDGRIAVAWAGQVVVHDAGGAVVARRKLAADAGTPLVFLADGGVAMVGDPDGKRDHLVRWDLATGATTRLAGDLPPIASLSGHGDVLYAGDDGGQVVRIAAGRITARYTGRPVGVSAIVPSRDGAWVAIEHGDAHTVVANATDLAVVTQLPAASPYASTAAFDPTGRYLARTSAGKLQLIERETGEALVTLPAIAGVLDDPMFGDDPELLSVIADGVPAYLPLRRDRRPAAAIVAEIECRVPLRVRGSALENVVPTCK